jgi:hypothetical protein
MPHTAFSIHFRGRSVRLSPGVLTARATAPSGALVTFIDDDGVHGRHEPSEGGEAHLECRITLLDDERFEEVGTISFGNGNTLRFRTLGEGILAASERPGLSHGASTWTVDGGAGTFAGATGRIVSNFLLADTGELTDHHLGVLFLMDRGAPEDQTGRESRR